MTDDMPGDGETQRLRAWGNELIRMHDLFRADLAAIRRDSTRGGSIGRPAESALRTRCVTFCTELHAHHTMEDNALFPHLDREHPELARALQTLRDEHAVIARLLDRIEAALEDPDASDIDAELAVLSSELESHLDYEEEQLVPVLNRLTSLPTDDIQREEDRLAETASVLRHRIESEH